MSASLRRPCHHRTGRHYDSDGDAILDRHPRPHRPHRLSDTHVRGDVDDGDVEE